MGTQPGFSTRATSVPNLSYAISIAPVLYTCVFVYVCVCARLHFETVTLCSLGCLELCSHAGLKFIVFIPTSLLDFIVFFVLS